MTVTGVLLSVALVAALTGGIATLSPPGVRTSTAVKGPAAEGMVGPSATLTAKDQKWTDSVVVGAPCADEWGVDRQYQVDWGGWMWAPRSSLPQT